MILNRRCFCSEEVGKVRSLAMKAGRVRAVAILTVFVLLFAALGTMTREAAAQSVTGTIQLPATGQVLCYGPAPFYNVVDCACTGQDGETQTGILIPSRFHDNGDGTVTDLQTGLMWLKDTNCMGTHYAGIDHDWYADGAVSYATAAAYVAGVNNGTYPNCAAGYNDWRLPSLSELASIFDYAKFNGSYLYSQGGFNIPSTPTYWTSTASSRTLTLSADMWFGTAAGEQGTANALNNFVWTVRSGPNGNADPTYPANVPKTGQTACATKSGSVVNNDCAGTGQDGELQWGISWPNPRFANPDGTAPVSGELAVDRLTGLMWTANSMSPGPAACGAGEYKTWQQIIDYVKCLNNNKYLGYTDWRMPNVVELKSLVHVGQTDGITWLQAQGFTISSIHYYFFTSTTVASDTTTDLSKHAAAAWMVEVGYGDDDLSEKEPGVSPAWPVRGGTVKNTPPDGCWTSITADLNLALSAASSEVAAGGTIIYTATITNYGPNTATGVVLANTLPTGTTYISAAPSQGSCTNAGSAITCSLGSIASGNNATVEIRATAPGTNGTIANTAVVSATSRDTNTVDNLRTVDVTVVGGALNAPVVTTASVSAVTSTTATSGGTVSADGGATVTARGVCRAASANPTTADTCSSNGSGTGIYESSLTGLSPSTGYHVRAYATNSVGTAYGQDVSFTTTASTAVLTLTPGTTSLSVKAGDDANLELEVGSTGTPDGEVTFSCSGLPAGTSCSFSPASVAAAQLPSSVTMTVRTTSSTKTAAVNPWWSWVPILPAVVLVPVMRRRPRSLFAVLALVTFLAAGLAACGGSGGGGSSGPAKTPPGTYAITVTAEAPGATSAAAEVSLTVTE